MAYSIGIDLGGSNIVAGLVSDRAKLIAKYGTKTPKNAEAETIVEAIHQTTMTLLKRENISIDEVEQIGIGTPGIVDTKNGIVLFANNLNFRNTPLSALAKLYFKQPIHLINDANAAAYGEYIGGSARGASSLVAITIGTGIGGGIILNNQVITGFAYAGAELGHMVIDIDGRSCSCGRQGCFETYASATGLVNTTKAYMRNHPETIMWDLCKDSLGNVSGRTAFDAKRMGDRGGERVVADYIHTLAIGLGNIINSIEPEVLVIGGGLSNEGDELLIPLQKELDKQVFRFTSNQTELRIASLGNDAGIIGAALSGNQGNS